MRLDGWIFLVSGWTVILWLTAYCFIKVMVSVNKQKNGINLKVKK